MHVELRQQPRADEGADHADDEVADKSEAGALHDLPCEPAGNDADHHYKEKIFTRHMYVRVLQLKLSAAPPTPLGFISAGSTATVRSSSRRPEKPSRGRASVARVDATNRSAALRISNPTNLQRPRAAGPAGM